MINSIVDYMILAVLFQGLAVGGVYALAGSSLSISLGLRFPNMALGSFLVLGCYSEYFLVTLFGLNFFVAMIVGLIPLVPFYLLLDKAIFSRLYLRPDPAMTFLVLALGVFTAISGLYDTVIQPDPRTLQTPYSSTIIQLAGFPLNFSFVVSIILEAALLAVLFSFMLLTRQGRTLRAIVQDKELVELMGANVFTLSRMAFMLTSIVSTLTGMIYTLAFSFDPTISVMGIVLFALVLVGGPGSVRGSAIIGFIFGFTQAVVSLFFYPTFSVFVFYGILFVILLVRPEGLFKR